MKILTLLCVVLGVTGFGCQIAPKVKLTDGGKRVRIVSYEDEIKGCKLVGKTTVEAGRDYRRHTLKTKARNNAAASKGTHIIEVFDPDGHEGVAIFHVYRCPYGTPLRR